MTDTALAELLRAAVRAEVEPLRRLLERLAPPPLTPQQRELFDALVLVIGSAAFTAAEALELSRVHLGDRPRLATALAAVGATDAHKLGMALGGIVKRSQLLEVRLVKAGDEFGSNMWQAEGLGELEPREPRLRPGAET